MRVPENLSPDDDVTTLDELARAVDKCKLCPLYCNATQGVAGEGPKAARIMLVGEQPGDQEDLQGRPFVGPAGQVLNEALDEAGGLRRAAVEGARGREREVQAAAGDRKSTRLNSSH